MSLKEILERIVKEHTPILLSNGKGDWEAGVLLATLTPAALAKKAFYQPGLYVAAINEGGYLGEVLYRIKNTATV